MLPVKLKMQAFASYAEAAEIDFEKLENLFLICGETGAGKTAVLDAMMYALYGESSGGERSEMRCALPAAAELPTEVEFTFRIKGGLYTFVRSIVFTPRSKKLDTRQDCFYYDEDGSRRAFFENPKQSNVREKAEELTGLTAEQFRQVVILPQGRFERLLTSGSAEKEAVLSTLFGAEKYTALSDKLSEKAAAMRAETERETAALKAMLAAENAESEEALSEEISRLENEAEALAPKLAEAKKAMEDTREKLAAAKALSEKFSQLAENEKRFAELDARKDETENLRALLKKHENALKAKPEQSAANSAEEDFSARKNQLISAGKALASEEENFKNASEKHAVILKKEDAHKELLRELSSLEILRLSYEKLAPAETACAGLSAERKALETHCAGVLSEVEKTGGRIAELSALREKITREFSRNIPALAEEAASLKRGRDAAAKLGTYTEELEKIRMNISALEAEAKTLEAKKNKAEQTYEKLYGEYISNAAAELSSDLKDGMPCPVCGSTSHPRPAVPSGNAVSADDVKKARADFEAAAKAVSEKLAKADAEKARIPNAEIYIAAEEKTVSDTGYTEERFREISERYAEAVGQDKKLPDIDKQLDELAKLKISLEEQLRSKSEKLAAIKNTETRAEAELSALRAQLDSRYKDMAAYSAGVTALKNKAERFAEEKKKTEEELSAAEKRKIETAAAHSKAEEEYSKAKTALEEANSAFEKKLAALGIAKEEYEASLLAEENALRFAEEVRVYDLERHAVSEQLSSLRTQLDGKTPPALDELNASAKETETLLSELSGKEAVAAEKLSRLKKLSEDYSAKRKKSEAAREQSDKLTAFAKFMHGDKGISFTRYVLGIMLSLVTSEANRLLADIKGGKFRLRVKTELGAGSKQGLDLEVENLTAERSVRYGVKNLSGGEKFLISLALSLGLSSVARSRNGGIDIEAMFIDEGFGSLDPASLREAVNILCGLTLGRNTVGIISHVEELKNVIPHGISVAKNTDGTSKLSLN